LTLEACQPIFEFHVPGSAAADERAGSRPGAGPIECGARRSDDTGVMGEIQIIIRGAIEKFAVIDEAAAANKRRYAPAPTSESLAVERLKF
jgi:hypothetical protein